ncbi:peptidase [Streptomonospora alba]|uniref:Peptidase n=1 Tax=Streptomonospora alba TaxID=183763 RepID=A0A0C2G1L0_9ACTN|nr:chaplin [Streptomonospora alba]KIH97183.1 peptidase [Streptomonospora alba]
MRKRFYTSLSASLLAAGLVGAAPATAFAGPESDGSGGIGSGNQLNVPADVKAELCGNALSVLGISQADCTRVAEVLYASSDEGEDSPQTDGSGGVASGNQINIPVDAALDVCGNSAAIGGVAESDCTTVVKKLVDKSEDGDSPQTDGSGGVASGNQINIPVDIALDVCGNSVAVLGASKAECTTVVNVIQESAGDEGEDSPQTDGSGGVASGNQVNVPVDAAVDICGNAVSVLGVAKAECLEKISEDDGGEDPGDDSGKETEPPEGDDETDDPKDPGEDGPGDGDKTPSPEPSPQPSGDSTPDTKPAPEGDDTDASGGLPVTGPALGGLVAAAVAAVGGGGAAMVISRRRKAAAVGTEDAAGAEE